MTLKNWKSKIYKYQEKCRGFKVEQLIIIREVYIYTIKNAVTSFWYHPWSFHLRTCIFFFTFKVLLMFVDVGTDVMTGK